MNGKAAGNFRFIHFRNGGSADMNVNGSITPVNFDILATETITIERVNFTIVDSGIRPSRFGALAALANGLEIKVLADDGVSVRRDFLDGEPITTNAQFGKLAGSDVIPESAAADDLLPVRWTIAKAGSSLKLSTGQTFRITINDDLQLIDYFQAMAQGVRG